MQPITIESDSSRPTTVHTMWSGWAAAVIAIPLATVAVEAAPHTQGIGFFPELRYSTVAAATLLLSLGAAIGYRAAMTRFERPRVVLAAAVVALAALVLVCMATGGRHGLVSAGLPSVLCIAAVVALLVPRFVSRRSRSRVPIAAIILVGTFELAGVVRALASERTAPAGPYGMAFDVPRNLFDADHRFLDLSNGARIHYVDVGAGPTLLFLHGNPSWSFQWRDLIAGLRGSYRCIAPDHPGFGLSTAPPGYGYTPDEQSHVLEEFVDRLDLRDVTLILQDWGGPIGIGLAERRPELVRNIVLGSTWAWPTATSEPRGQWSVVAGGPVGEFLQVNFNGVVSFGLSSSIVRELPPDVADVYTRPFLPIDHRGIAAFYPREITAENRYFADLEAGLPRVSNRSALIFWALQDVGFPRADLARWERTFAKHKTIELPGANHFFFEDAADQVIAEIRAFASPTPP
jgi:pimeloyl-ACP methyl ester carboxylesterase